MRKKSHISLARDIVRNSEDEGLRKHKWAFYLGSILPDIKPSFLYKKHEIDGTFEQVKKEVRELSDSHGKYRKHATKYYRDLGQITHYIADYFTFPHNRTYPGNLKDHCSYEEVLKLRLREYLKTDKKDRWPFVQCHFGSAEALCDFIKLRHEEYLCRGRYSAYCIIKLPGSRGNQAVSRAGKVASVPVKEEGCITAVRQAVWIGVFVSRIWESI